MLSSAALTARIDMKGRSTMDKNRRWRIFLVDDHPLVREWLAGMIALQPDLEICGQADDAAAALASVAKERPDLVIVDLTMPRSSGLELIKDFRAQSATLRLLVLTAHEDSNVAERALRAGANGYAIKRQSGPQIIEAIRTVAGGKFYAAPGLANQLAARIFAPTAQKSGAPEDVLSDRELTVFQLRGQGRNAKEIADILRVSVKTVGSYDARAKEKLGLNSFGELTREAVLWHNRRVGL